ncbi:TlpA family protein disulfide reductase [Sphingobacterium detergens]|uniref:Thiol-disulfide isomerase/thioredoxin n=1 Tax=Sphingobacterium detergens TaxID=1145106 RepID=A0A420AGS7_SPHD1|nr:TlpA disulfide reductase family protein [Sphingobacterium detergens]RKE43536.1 thiol-disulfide isomerase/thioredoxin [Sphingobacterium detergens]
MNKLWIYFLFLTLSPSLLSAQGDNVTIKGKITSSAADPATKLSVSFIDYQGKRQGFSAPINDGSFEIEIPKQARVVDATLRTIGKDPNASALQQVMRHPLNVFIFKDDILIDGNAEELDLAQVKGGEENNEYNNLRQSTAGFVKQKNRLYSPILEGKISTESPEGKTILEQLSQLGKKENDLQKKFIENYTESYVSLFLLYRMKSSYTSEDYKLAFNRLASNYKSTDMGKAIASTIAKETVTAKGKAAPLFTRTTAHGTPFNLEKMQGRVILLDFWGSWCGPCRASMPHLQQLYSRYKNKGFEIIGIAQERGKTIDESKNSWYKAIEELRLPWTNVLNNENKEQMDIVKEYQISGFPTKILVDENGKIILRVVASATDDIDIALKKIYGY